MRRLIKKEMSKLKEAIQYYYHAPVDFVEDVIRVKPDDNQKAILRSLDAEPMTSVRSGHGIGKSAVESWAILWYLCTRPYPKIPCTAPTQHQLFDILWAEASKWIRNTPALARELIWTKEKIYMRGHPEEWFAVARTATNPDALQGFHAEHVLFIIDEASGVKDIVFEPVLGALSTKGAKLLMCGNPTRLTGFFYDSHHKNRAAYNALHIDGRTCARVDQAFVDKIIDMFGADSDVFRIRVAGEFPKSEADSLISMEWCEAAAEMEIETKNERIDIGIDVARYGDDSSALYPLFDQRRSEEPEIYHHNRTTEISGYAVQMIKKYANLYPDMKIYRIKVDCDGLGVGVYDNLYDMREQIVEEIWMDRCTRTGLNPEEHSDYLECLDIPKIDLEIMECHFGGAGGKVREEDPIEYSNSTGIMWGAVRQALMDGTLQIPNNDTLISQLSSRKYTVNKDGHLELERKEAMKKRGLPSPDIADALALALYEPQGWNLYI